MAGPADIPGQLRAWKPWVSHTHIVAIRLCWERNSVRHGRQFPGNLGKETEMGKESSSFDPARLPHSPDPRAASHQLIISTGRLHVAAYKAWLQFGNDVLRAPSAVPSSLKRDGRKEWLSSDCGCACVPSPSPGGSTSLPLLLRLAQRCGFVVYSGLLDGQEVVEQSVISAINMGKD